MVQHESDAASCFLARNQGKLTPIGWQSHLVHAEALKIDDREPTAIVQPVQPR
jgi:hypothetical protein